MQRQQRYSQNEGHYNRDTHSPRKWVIAVGAIVVACVIALVFIVSNTKTDEGKMVIHNADLCQMSVSDLEYVASNSKNERDKNEALYLLFENYKKRNVQRLYDFYQSHKGDNFSDEAYGIVVHKCDSMYAEALAIDTEQGWPDYLVSVPEDFYRDAMDRYLEFKWSHTADRWDTEEKAWAEADSLKGPGAYERYVKMYPEGEHVVEAQRELDRIRKAEIIREKNREADKKRYEKWVRSLNR